MRDMDVSDLKAIRGRLLSFVSEPAGPGDREAGVEDAYEAYNAEFHSCLYAGAHNTHVQELALQTRGRLAPFRRAQFWLPERLTKSWTEHDAIVRAIINGDGAAAGEAARAHVAIVSEASAVFAGGGRAPALAGERLGP